MLPDINQMTNILMRKFKRKMLDVIAGIFGETCTGASNHFQPIQSISNHSANSQKIHDYPLTSISSYYFASNSVLASPIFIQNGENIDDMQTVQTVDTYTRIPHDVLNLSNFGQVQQSSNTSQVVNNSNNPYQLQNNP